MYLIYMELFIFLLVCPCAAPLSPTCLSKNLCKGKLFIFLGAGVTKGLCLSHPPCSRAASAC